LKCNLCKFLASNGLAPVFFRCLTLNKGVSPLCNCMTYTEIAESNSMHDEEAGARRALPLWLILL